MAFDTRLAHLMRGSRSRASGEDSASIKGLTCGLLNTRPPPKKKGSGSPAAAPLRVPAGPTPLPGKVHKVEPVHV